jgi:7-keto-8-aminopelargonate synthetase-like enzyme
MREEPERVTRLEEIGKRMRKAYKEMGFNIGGTETPIIPIIIGDDEKTLYFWRSLIENGVFVNPVLSPAVPAGMQLLRTSYMATHTDAQLDHVLEVFSQVGKQVGLIS